MLLSTINQKPLIRNSTTFCMIASPDCRLTPRKENKCPSSYPNDVKTEDRAEFSDVSPSDEDDFEEETMNELVIIKDVDSVSIANFDDIRK